MTEKRIKDINNCHKKHEDRINLTVPKGERKRIQDHAAGHHESTNKFIWRAINETIIRDTETRNTEKIAKEYDIPVEKAQEAIELTRAVALIDSKIPGFKELYDSKQLSKVIANRV